MKIMFHFFLSFLENKKEGSRNNFYNPHFRHKQFTNFFEINEKRGVCATEKRTNSLCKVDYLSSNPIHTTISLIGIYQICTVKNEYKKPRSCFASGLFALASILSTQHVLYSQFRCHPEKVNKIKGFQLSWRLHVHPK